VDKVKGYPSFSYISEIFFSSNLLYDLRKHQIFLLQLYVNLHLETKLWLITQHPQRDLVMKSPQHLVGVNLGIDGGSHAAYKVKKADSYPAGLTEKNLPT
jgi:hypothetical protein